MEREHFNQIERIFHEALELEAGGAREEFLASACQGSPELEAEIRALLQAHSTPSGVLDRPHLTLSGEAKPWIGQRVGPYRLVEEVGQGGMGVVFRAERDDQEFQQTVALKLVGHRIIREDLLRRFRNERQILAKLQHPNIARLLDGGTTPDGQPYLVMEFIEGQAITTYCDARQLGVQARLDLFQKVCQAVHFAHQNLVIHRDLKPSNILVTAQGQVKLLDFGIAKVLQDTEGVDETVTASVQPVMTPNWASPEQIQGNPLTTASDIYSLGVLLFSLLCGRKPYPATSFVDLLRAVVEKDPPCPSAALADSGGEESPPVEVISANRSSHPAALRRGLEGDLDMITLKCLQKEPSRRYDSAHELAIDIRHHLRGLPVQAQLDSRAYRFRKFVGRNRAAMGVAAALLVTLLAGLSGIVWQARQAALQRDRAQREADKAKRVVALMQEVFRRASPYDTEAARDLSAGEILERGAKSIRDELTEEPETRAAIMGEIGWALNAVGRLESAGELLAETLEIQRRELDRNDPELATTLHRYALFQDEQGDYEKAEQLFREALRIREVNPGPDHPDYADTLCQLAYQLSFSNSDQNAGDLFNRSLEIFEKGAANRTVPALVCRHNYASMLRRTGRYPEAIETFRETLRLGRGAFSEPLAEELVTLEGLALALRQNGQLDEAESLYLEVLAGKRERLGPAHPTVGSTLNNLAKLYEVRGEPAKAGPLYEQALDIMGKEYGPDHANTGVILANLAVVRHKLGEDQRAEPLFRQALEIYAEAVPSDHPYVGSALAGLGELLNAAKRYREAEEVLRRALEIRRKSLPPGDPNVIKVLLALGDSLFGRRQFENALKTLGAALGELDPKQDEAALLRICGHLRTALGDSSLSLPESCPPAKADPGD